MARQATSLSASLSGDRVLGLADDAFEQRRPLRGQITKREVRAVALYSLGLGHDSLVWDVGAGTGSISIEAGLIARDGRVLAIERDPETLPLLRRNVAQMGSGNVEVVVGEAPEVLEELESPDSVFIGGSGGKLEAILDLAAARLNPGGRIVMNLAVLERANWAYHRVRDLGLSRDLVMVQAARGKDMADGTVRLESLNPVFVVSGRRED